MKPLYMKLKAFGPFAETEAVSFDRVFDGGLFLIHGRTGAGKTSLLDGLCFSLFGRPSSEEREKDLRALRSDLATADTMTETELIFVIGSTAYRVHRIPTQVTPKKRGEGFTEHKGSAELYRLEASVPELRDVLSKADPDITKLTWTPLAGKVEAVDGAIESLVGMNERQFRQVVVLPQGRFREFLSSTSNERQAILEKLFQTDRFSRLQQFIASRARTGEAQLREASQAVQMKLAAFGLASVEDVAPKLSELQTQSELITKDLGAARERAERLGQELNRAKEFELARNRHLALQAEAARLEERTVEIGNLKRKILSARAWIPHFQMQDLASSLAAKHGDLERKQSQTQASLTSLKARKAASQAQLKALQEKQPSLETMATERSRLRELVQPLKDLALAQKQLEASEAGARTTRSTIDDLKSKAAMLEADQKKQLAQLFAIDAHQTAEESHSLESEDRRIKGIELKFHHGEAARLAQSLSPGAPCPVCGSSDHPRPADKAAGLDGTSISADMISRERASFEKLRLDITARRTKRQSRLEPYDPVKDAGANGVADFTKTALIFDQSVAALRETLKTVDIQTAEQAARDEAIARLRQEIESKTALIPMADRSLDVLMKRGLELKTAQESREVELKKTESELNQSESDLSRLEGTVTALDDEAKRLGAERSDLSRRLDELQSSIERSLAAQQADTTRPSQRHEEKDILGFERDIETFNQNVTTNKASLAEVEKTLERATANRTTQDIAAEFSTATARRTELEQTTARLKVDIEGITKLEAETKTGIERLTRLKDDAERASRMSALLTGDKTQNKLLVPLSRFVLQSRFEDVLDQANRRLGRMSRGQFQLRRPALSRNLRDSQGLELSVEDSVAGKERHAGSLSGGESFMAALSLALGLADVVQADLGGVRLDSVLIDEGFGTLDSESLDLAMKTLVDLQAGGRLVGIISHVQELKSQVHHQLEVVKSAHGSHVRWNVSI